MNTEDWDPLLLHMLISKLDRTYYMLFKLYLINPKKPPPTQYFLSFVDTQQSL